MQESDEVANGSREVAPMTNFMPATKKKAGLTRSFWLKQLHRWHWNSAALSLVGMLLFAVTGITLNHAADIEASTTVTEREARLPPPLRKALTVGGAEKATPPTRARDSARRRTAG